MIKYILINTVVLLILSYNVFGQERNQNEITWKKLKICDQKLIKCNSKFGVILVNGDTIIPCVYDSIIPYSTVYWKDYYYSAYYVKKNNYWGVHNGQSLIVPIRFNRVYIRDNMISVLEGSSWGLYNNYGQQLLPCKYDSDFSFNIGFSLIKEGGKNGFIDKRGLIVIPIIYNDASNFSGDGLAAVKKDNDWGFIDTTGEYAIEPKYDYVQSFYKGYAWFRVDSSINNVFYHGLLDTAGNELFLNEFDQHHHYFSNGLLAVKRKQKWGFINFNKDVIIKLQYDSVTEFIEGYAEVNKNGETMYINTKGKEFVSGIKYYFIKKKYNKYAL